MATVIRMLRLLATAAAAGGLLFLGSIIFSGTVSAFSTDRDPNRDVAEDLFDRGKQIFRFDTFGDERFWGDTLRLHDAIKGEAAGGVGPGVSPKTALAVGLKVDSQALPQSVVDAIKAGQVDLDDPATTVTLLKLNSVVGVKGFFDDAGSMTSIGITCAVCHSTVDDSFAPGIGKRLDGWPNRDLNVGAIVSLAPNLKPFTDHLGVDEATVKQVLASWGPGRYDAELNLDGKAFRPDGKSGSTLIPPAFGLAGVNLHTYTGWGSVPYWNAYVGVTQMHGQGTFFDPRLDDPVKFPLAARAGLGHIRSDPDLVSDKLPALHAYQLALKAPKAPEGSFDKIAAQRGKRVFMQNGKCADCHVPPTYSEPGFNMHKPAAICTDAFQANRSPDGMYRTTPLKGLWSHQKGGFYHDGRFKTLGAVVDHYDSCFGLGLSAQEKSDLVEFLRGL